MGWQKDDLDGQKVDLEGRKDDLEGRKDDFERRKDDIEGRTLCIGEGDVIGHLLVVKIAYTVYSVQYK
jgi:hypothetical protein